MALADASLNAMANHLASLVTHVSVHTADPGAGGANESAAARQAVTWTSASSGDISATATLSFTGGTASGACTHVGLWSASSGGTFYGSYALSGDTTFNPSGEYNVTNLTINGSAT